mgnify:CR=1 FL=1
MTTLDLKQKRENQKRLKIATTSHHRLLKSLWMDYKMYLF